MPVTTYENNTLTFHGLDCFDLARSCACGQCFRWTQQGNGWFGIVEGRAVLAVQSGNTLSLTPSNLDDANMWRRYFDLDRCYASIEKGVSCDPVLAPCIPYASGIHIFAQDPFETLISFIISANNNIKRISGIVERLCALAGDRIDCEAPAYAFPAPEAIAALSESQLTAIGSGYRAPYIKKSAAMAAAGYDLEALRALPLKEARHELLYFPGVGPKVADCVLLFSLGHMDAFPMDVWMKRAMARLYFGGNEPPKAELERAISGLGENSGILQQYIFHYARENMR